MSGWAAKRFWKTAEVAVQDAGFAVHLDGRPVKTPAKNALVVPTKALADLIAAEWNAQTGKVNPETMPMTRRANSALEKVAPNRTAVIDELAGFGASDLLCYRAEAPLELTQRQSDVWQPLLDWAVRDLSAPLRVTAGIVFVAQPEASLSALRRAIEGYDNFRLAGLHDLVAISGSLVIALAVARGHVTQDLGFAASRIDEDWQAQQWGADEEATAMQAHKAAAFRDAYTFLAACT